MKEMTLSKKIKSVDSSGTATETTRKRYDRLSRFYNFMEIMMENRHAQWRKQLWSEVRGEKVLEIGIGTGKNIEYYPGNIRVTGIDLSPGMIKYAEERSNQLEIPVDIHLGDAQNLGFPNRSFDAVVATCVFCSVPDPVQGLREAGRVLKPGGKIYLLEHMRSPNSRIGKLLDFLNPIIVRMIGANINRRTMENIQAAGLKVASEIWLDKMGIFRFLVISP